MTTGQKFLAANKGNNDAVRTLVLSFESRGDFEWNEKDYRAAEAAYAEMLSACRGGPEPAGEAAKKDAGGQAKAAPGMGADERDLLARAYEGLGCMRDQLKNDQGAREAFEQLIPVRTKLAEERSWDPEVYKRLRQAYERLAWFASRRRDFPLAFRAAKGQADALEQAVARSEDAVLVKDLARDYVNLSWYALWARKPDEAVSSAKRGMELTPEGDPLSAELATNLAHGFLFQGRWEEAAAIYRKFRTANIDDKRTFVEATRGDFREFRERGLTHPDLDRAERLFDEPQSPPRP